MEEQLKSLYIKRTQKDYSLSLKLQIVKEVEFGESLITHCRQKYGIKSHATVLNWLRTYGNFDWDYQRPYTMEKTPEQRIMELETSWETKSLFRKAGVLSQNKTLENFMDYRQKSSGSFNTNFEYKSFYQWQWKKMIDTGVKNNYLRLIE